MRNLMEGGLFNPPYKGHGGLESPPSFRPRFEHRTWFRVRLPAHERALLAVPDQVTLHDTPQDKSLIVKEKS